MSGTTRIQTVCHHTVGATTIAAILVAAAACQTEPNVRGDAGHADRQTSADCVWQARVRHIDAMLAACGHDIDELRSAADKRLSDSLKRTDIRAALDRAAVLG